MVGVLISIWSVVGGSWSVVGGWSVGGGFVLRHHFGHISDALFELETQLVVEAILVQWIIT